MMRNDLKIAFRNIFRIRGYTFINILGLALGMVCCILIMLWVQDELSYDRFHKNIDRLYLVTHHFENGWGSSTPWAMAPVLKKDFPEIEKTSRVYDQNLPVKCGDQSYYESIAFVDPEFLEMFTFPMLQGDPTSALDARQSVVITGKIARKYFNGENPVGKILQLDRNLVLTVTGIIENVPSNSSIEFDMLVPIGNLGDDRLATWSSEAQAFVLLGENANVENLRVKMAGTTSKYDRRMDNSKVIDDLYPLARLHLYGLGGTGSILYVWIFSAIAIIVLIIACINFINLLTAQATVRSREIGMRKVVGAGKRHLIRQFYTETFLKSVIAFILALIVTIIIMPGFNVLAAKDVSLKLFSNPSLIIGSVSIIILATLLAGSYPAFLLSSFRPERALKETSVTGLKKSTLRKFLVVCQFVVSVILIVMTVTMQKQIKYIQNKNLGFNREQVISIPLNDDSRSRFEGMKNHLLQYPGVTHISWATFSPNAILFSNPVYWEGRGPEQYENMSYVVVDYDYLETFEFDILEGRNFSREYSTDSLGYIVNERAIDFMQMESPIGKMFSIWQAEGNIIGVVKDFHSVPLHNEIPPVVMTLIPFMPPTQAFIRIKPTNIGNSLALIENTWKEFMPDYPFQYEFLDDAFGRQYKSEERTRTLFLSFCLMAILISCIGLFGLAAFIAQRKTKEIGIRKVAGATVLEIQKLMISQFVGWILTAIAIAVPIAWYIMDKWLEGFAYRTGLRWWIFSLAGVIVLGIALITISWQAYRAANRNPVESLRYE